MLRTKLDLHLQRAASWAAVCEHDESPDKDREIDSLLELLQEYVQRLRLLKTHQHVFDTDGICTHFDCQVRKQFLEGALEIEENINV